MLKQILTSMRNTGATGLPRASRSFSSETISAEQGPGLTRSDFLGLMATGLVTAGVGLSSTRAFAQTASDTSPVTDIDKVYDAWQDRFNAGDIDGLMALYADDCTYVNPDGVQFTTKDKFRPDYQGLLDLKPKIVLGDRVHVVYHDISLTTNHWTLEFPNDSGGMETLTGGGIEVIRNMNNEGWLFIIDDASRSAS